MGKIDSGMKRPLPLVLLAAFTLVSLTPPANVRGEEPKLEDLHKAFSEMLTDATFKGTWAPIAGGELGEEKDDGYKIVRVTKKKGYYWEFITRMNIRGTEIDFPMPIQVRFAGDTAVLILNDVPVGEGKTYSARVMIHNDVYAGSWWGVGGKGGTISGTISRGDGEKN